MTDAICNPCKKPVAGQSGTTRFPCPKCSKVDIIRCLQCREISAKYTCPECGFEGPN